MPVIKDELTMVVRTGIMSCAQTISSHVTGLNWRWLQNNSNFSGWVKCSQ